MKVAGAALNLTPLDWKGNYTRIVEAIQHAKSESVKILVLPELTVTGYGCEDLFLSNWVSEKAVSQLGKIAPATADIFVAVGTPAIWQSHVYNCVCVFRNGEILGVVPKQNLPIDGVHYETRWFKAWRSGMVESITINNVQVPFGDLTFDIEDAKIGFEICEDAWVPENRPANRLQEKGVNLILNPSASHFAMGKSQDRIDLICKSSKDFNCAYIYTNLLGNEAGRMIYEGDILIAQYGELITRNANILSLESHVLANAEISFSGSKGSTGSKEEYSYNKNEEFVEAVSLGLFDYLRKCKSRGFVLSISGGADSSICAVLVSEMVRRGCKKLKTHGFLEKLDRLDIWKQVKDLGQTEQQRAIVNGLLTAAYQSTSNSSAQTLESAEELATSIGANFYSWSVQESLNSLTNNLQKAIGREFNWKNDDLALQNIQARSRTPLIWMLANINNALLLTTSNRSEGSVGYTTMDGDTAGSIAPIAGIDKVFIREWLKWAEISLGYDGLKLVNSLEPTAELRPSAMEQTDETDLMPYPILQQIEELAIHQHKSPIQIFEQLNDGSIEKTNLIEYVKKYFSLWSRNQWKRERIAPAFHLDDYSLDPKSWCRYPILSAGFEEELNHLDQYL